MELRTCPVCGKMISPKATVCPFCKTKFSIEELKICEDCGTDYAINLSACPNCGCPNSEQKRKSNTASMFMTVIALIVIAMIGFILFYEFKKAEYCDNMEAVTYTMINGAGMAENAGNLISSVWFNALFERRDNETDKYTMEYGIFVGDFNDALAKLFDDDSFINSVSRIKTNQSEVIDFMKELNNPPKEYEEAYSVLKIYYANYMNLINTVIEPRGIYYTFAENFNECVEDTVDSYEEMVLYLQMLDIA